MDLGLHYWNFSTPGDPQRIADTLAAAAQTAEKAGLAEFSVMDHYGHASLLRTQMGTFPLPTAVAD